MPTYRAFPAGHSSSKTYRSAGGLILVLALITGLLNFPSVCHCGAELPHPHSLFLLADHHHSPDGEIESSAHDNTPDTESSPPATRAIGPGPFVQGAGSEGGTGIEIGFALTGMLLPAWSGALTFAGWHFTLPIPTTAEPPELPPPRGGSSA